MPLIDTPIELHYLPNGKPIWVKREDLCCPSPGPPFSKIRGILRHLQGLKSLGITTVGYAESKVSMASWGISWACNIIKGVTPIIYTIDYKVGAPPLLSAHRKKWEDLGGITRLTKLTRGKIIHNHGKTELRTEFGSAATMLPMGLPFIDTLEETTRQVLTHEEWPFKSLVICVGSGVICSGILRGLAGRQADTTVYGVTVRHFDNPGKKRMEILERAGLFGGLLFPGFDFRFINSNCEYLDFERLSPPFPSNPYYDRKAWRWLVNNYNSIEHPCLFWNIGAGGIPEEIK